MNIAEIREQYPQYDDLDDVTLAQGLHQKHYSDLDFKDFSKRIGLETGPGLTVGRVLSQMGRAVGQGVADIARAQGATEEARNIPEEVDFMRKEGFSAETPMQRQERLLKRAEALKSGGDPRQADIAAMEDERFNNVSELNQMATAMPEMLPGSSGRVEDAAAGMARFAPSMAVSAVNPLAGSAVTFAQLMGMSYDNYRKQGVDSERAFETALVNAAAQTPLEMAGNLLQIGALKNLVKTFKVKGAGLKRVAALGEALAKGAAGEGAEEFLQQYPDEIANIYAANPDLTPDEIAQEVWRRKGEITKQAVDASKTGALGGTMLAGAGGIIAAPASILSYRSEKQQQIDAKKAETVKEETPEQAKAPVEPVQQEASPQEQPQPEQVGPPVVERPVSEMQEQSKRHFDNEYQKNQEIKQQIDGDVMARDKEYQQADEAGIPRENLMPDEVDERQKAQSLRTAITRNISELEKLRAAGVNPMQQKELESQIEEAAHQLKAFDRAERERQVVRNEMATRRSNEEKALENNRPWRPEGGQRSVDFNRAASVAPVEDTTPDVYDGNGFDPLSIIKNNTGQAPIDRTQESAIKSLDEKSTSLKQEISDWKNRQYKSNKSIVSAGGTKDDLNSTLTTIDSANNRRKQRNIQDREKALADIENAKKRIQNGEDIDSVLDDHMDDRFLWADSVRKSIVGATPAVSTQGAGESLTEQLKGMVDERGNFTRGTDILRDMTKGIGNDEIIDAIRWAKSDEASPHVERFVASDLAAILRGRGVPVDEISWQQENIKGTPGVQAKGAKQPWENSDLAVSPNISSSRIQAEKISPNKYRLVYRGTRNEIFPGEVFKSAAEARQFFKVQKIKAQEYSKKQPALSPKEAKPKKRPSRNRGAKTIRGRIKEMGNIKVGNFAGELKDAPVAVKYLTRKNFGLPLDLVEKSLKEEGWMRPDESLLDALIDGQNAVEFLKRRHMGQDIDQREGAELTDREKAIRKDMEWEPEEPPPGDYVTVKAEDLPMGKKLTILEDSSREGWDEYEIIEKDPFGVTLKDGTIIELSPLDEVQVRSQDLATGPSLELKQDKYGKQKRRVEGGIKSRRSKSKLNEDTYFNTPSNRDKAQGGIPFENPRKRELFPKTVDTTEQNADNKEHEDSILSEPSTAYDFKAPQQTEIPFGMPGRKPSQKIRRRVSTRMVTTGNIAYDGNLVRNTADAAALLASIRKNAQENAYTVAVDKNGVVLEIHRYTKGVRSASHILPVEIAGRAMNVPGVAKVYFAHNHPSGKPSPSPEDVNISKRIDQVLSLADIKFDPFVIGGTNWASVFFGSESNIRPTIRKTTLPVKERAISLSREHQKNPIIADNPQKAQKTISALYDNMDGFLFLDNKMHVLGFLETPTGKSVRSAAAEIIKEAEATNAAGMIFNSTKPFNSRRKRLVKGISGGGLGVAVFDVIAEGKSLQERGAWSQAAPASDFSDMVSDETTLYSTQTQEQAAKRQDGLDKSIQSDTKKGMTRKDGAGDIPINQASESPEGGIFKIKSDKDFEPIVSMLDDLDPSAVGLRAIDKKDIGKKELPPSWLSRDDEDAGDWRELSGTSVVLVSGAWDYMADEEKIIAIKKAYERVLDYDLGYGIKIVTGTIDIDEVMNDPGESIFIDATVIGEIESPNQSRPLTQGGKYASTTPQGAASRHNLTYDGEQERPGKTPKLQFTDKQTGDTYTVDDVSELPDRVSSAREGKVAKANENFQAVTRDDVKAFFKNVKNSSVRKRRTDGAIIVQIGDRTPLRIKNVANIGIDSVAFSVERKRLPSDGEMAAGSYVDGEIKISSIGNIKTLYHELEHWMEHLGVLNKADIRALDKATEKTPELFDKDDSPREKRAKWYEEYQDKRNVNSRLKKAIQKIADFLDAFINLFHRTSRGVIRDIESGKAFAAGSVNTNGNNNTKYSPSPAVPADKLQRAAKEYREGMPLYKTQQYRTKTVEDNLKADTINFLDKVKAFAIPKHLTKEGKTDLKYIQDLILRTPAFFKEKIPAVWKIFNASQDRMDDFHENIFNMENHDDVNVVAAFKSLRKASKEQSQKVNQYIVDTDREDSGFGLRKNGKKWEIYKGKKVYAKFDSRIQDDLVDRGEEEAKYAMLGYEYRHLEKQGFNEQQIEAVLAFRQSTNKGFDVLIRNLRELRKKFEDAGMDPPDFTITDENGENRQISIQAAMAQMNDLRGSYFPRIRKRGRYVLTAFKDGEYNILETFNSRRMMSVRQDALSKQGYDVKTSKSKRLGEDVFEMAGELVKTQQIVNAALEKVDKALSSKKDIDQINAKIDEIFVTSLSEQIANVIRERGSRLHMSKRSANTYVGYEEDAELAIAKYIRSISGGEAKRKMVVKMLHALTGTETSWKDFQEQNPDADYDDYRKHVQENMIDQREQENAFKWAKAYIGEVTRNMELADEVIGTIKGVAVAKYLATRVFAAPLVNLTALPTSVVASMKGAGIPYSKTWTLLGRGISDYGRYRRGKELSGDAKWIFDHIQKNGWDNPQFNSESLTVLRSKLGRGWDKAIEYGMFTFSESEKLNRGATISATFYGLKKVHPEKSNKWLAAQAKEISDNAHGIYNKGNYPFLAMGSNPAAQVARMFYVFRTFSHTYLQNMARLGFEKKDYGALAHMLIAPAVIAGAGASVLTPMIAAILKGFGFDEPEEEAYQKIGEAFGPQAESLARFGLAGGGGRGVSIKGSLAIGIGDIPTDLKSFLGAPGSVISDFYEGGRSIFRGDVLKGVEKISPTGIGNLARAYRESTEGVTTRTNAPVFYGREQLKPLPIETFYRAMSLNPARMAGIREQQWKERQLSYKYSEQRKEIYAKLKKFFLQPAHKRNKSEYAEILAEIQRYNEKAMGKLDNSIPLITPKSIKTNIKRSMKPTKRERLRQ